MSFAIRLLCIAAVVFLGSCTAKIQTSDQPVDSTATTGTTNTPMQKELFGKLPDGKEVYRHVLKNKNGVEVHVINYGGIITHLKVPNTNNIIEDVVLGYDSLEGYLKDSPYFGALIGRYGNRIANGKFKVDGTEYTLAQNNNGQSLHGGVKGFDKVFWDIQTLETAKGNGLKLTYLSKDMEEGYPGNLNVTVEYILRDDNSLVLNYHATTDKKTVVNLTQHTYFNLSGNARRDILDHQLTLNSDHYLPVSKVLIPTGELAPVNGTPFDFNTPTAVGKRINEKHEQLQIAGGYDHCWVLSKSDSLKSAGSLYDPSSGRIVEVLTTEPGIQFYSGNFLTGSITGKGGVVYKHRYGLCLETQHFPDSPNRPDFPSVVLEPGKEYRSQTIYRFNVK
jgi:aldose 1-epimerase